MLWSEKILDLFKHLKISATLPPGVVVLNPYKEKEVFKLCKKFYAQYYSDNHTRTLIIGINPGRFGGGLTGIPFTDPIKLETICRIPNNLKKKSELSSDFIYRLIESLGGPCPVLFPVLFQFRFSTWVYPEWKEFKLLRCPGPAIGTPILHKKEFNGTNQFWLE